MRRSLAAIIESPVPGQVKRGLCPPLDDDTAALLHECFTLDTAEKLSAVPDTEFISCHKENEDVHTVREMFPAAQRSVEVDGKNSDQIAQCFQTLMEDDHVLVFSATDSPTMPARCLELAFDALSAGKVDVVLGPAGENGYYLVGTSGRHPELFADAGWLSAASPQPAIEHFADLGLGWYMLPEWYRVCQPADLAYLKSELIDRSVIGSAACNTTILLSALVERGLI
jgi:glycosyltransferase A (GT-A) superfamily protein (DUF2064 family)